MKRLRIALPALAVVILALFLASGASADGTATWGISGVTPSLDTANGDYNSAATNAPAGSACPNDIDCSPQDNLISGTNPILPGPFAGWNPANTPHLAEDLGVWNPNITAPTSGQVLQIQVTGCAVEDTNAPSQESQGAPVNTVLFQTLTPNGDNWTVDNTAGSAGADGTYPFQVPFCNTATGVTAKTVTSFAPLHLCINAGDVVAFHDLGGFVTDSTGTQAYYPQGVPMKVLAPVSGVGTNSFVGVGASTIGPGVHGGGGQDSESGYGYEPDQELTMQVVEGSGNDAYGLCSGGFGDEPADSNAIDCDFTTTADGSGAANPVKYPDHPFCANAGQPIPGSNVPPSGTSTRTPGTTTPVSRPVTAPVLTNLKSNPPLFVAKRGAVFTYVDSHPGMTTLRFYLIDGTKQVLYKTLRHQDKVKVGFHISDWKAGNYVVDASSVYDGMRGDTVTAKFKVILTRTTPPVITDLKSNPPMYVAKRGAVFTYVDSHPGLTTLRFYLINGKQLTLVRTISHQDQEKVGFHVYGLPPGNYEVKASSVYQGLHGATVMAKFKVILKR